MANTEDPQLSLQQGPKLLGQVLHSTLPSTLSKISWYYPTLSLWSNNGDRGLCVHQNCCSLFVFKHCARNKCWYFFFFPPPYLLVSHYQQPTYLQLIWVVGYVVRRCWVHGCGNRAVLPSLHRENCQPFTPSFQACRGIEWFWEQYPFKRLLVTRSWLARSWATRIKKVACWTCFLCTSKSITWISNHI